MTKWVKIIDGVVDTIAMDQPGHFETVIETVEGDDDRPDTQGERKVFVPDLSYVEAKDSVYAGYTFDGKRYTPPKQEHSPAPAVVSSRQFKLQLLSGGLYETVETWVATQPLHVRIAYDNSATFQIGDETLQTGFKAMGVSVKDIEDFFIAASKL